MRCWVTSDGDPGLGFARPRYDSPTNRISLTHLSGATVVGQDVDAEDEGTAGSSGVIGEEERMPKVAKLPRAHTAQ